MKIIRVGVHSLVLVIVNIAGIVGIGDSSANRAGLPAAEKRDCAKRGL